MPLKRISIHQAKKLFADGNSIIILCPCKFYPAGPFSMGCRISGKEYLEDAERYKPQEGRIVSVLWKGTQEETAWKLMYNNWAFYNTSFETGYYAHYYIEI